MTISLEDEKALTDPSNLDAHSPDYYTESFRLVDQLLHNSLMDQPGSDTQQIETFLEGLAQADATFKWRKATDTNGNAICYIWQTGVMRRDFELYGSTLFLDRLGRSLNNKGWPLMTIAMLSGEKRVCLPCEAIAVGESVRCYAFMLEAMIDNQQRKPTCSLCLQRHHNVNRCRIIERYKAWWVQPRYVREMSARLGNPAYYEVIQPNEETTHLMEQHMVNSNSIPKLAWHLVLLNTYFSLIPDQSFQYNVVEVTVLEKGGSQLSGYERAFFPVHRVQSWMDKHCSMTKRKKHLLSTLRSRKGDEQVVEHHIDIYRNGL